MICTTGQQAVTVRSIGLRGVTSGDPQVMSCLSGEPCTIRQRAIRVGSMGPRAGTSGGSQVVNGGTMSCIGHILQSPEGMGCKDSVGEVMSYGSMTS